MQKSTSALGKTKPSTKSSAVSAANPIPQAASNMPWNRPIAHWPLKQKEFMMQSNNRAFVANQIWFYIRTSLMALSWNSDSTVSAVSSMCRGTRPEGCVFKAWTSSSSVTSASVSSVFVMFVLFLFFPPFFSLSFRTFVFYWASASKFSWIDFFV